MPAIGPTAAWWWQGRSGPRRPRRERAPQRDPRPSPRRGWRRSPRPASAAHALERDRRASVQQHALAHPGSVSPAMPRPSSTGRPRCRPRRRARWPRPRADRAAVAPPRAPRRGRHRRAATTARASPRRPLPRPRRRRTRGRRSPRELAADQRGHLFAPFFPAARLTMAAAMRTAAALLGARITPACFSAADCCARSCGRAPSRTQSRRRRGAARPWRRAARAGDGRPISAAGSAWLPWRARHRAGHAVRRRPPRAACARCAGDGRSWDGAGRA